MKQKPLKFDRNQNMFDPNAHPINSLSPDGRKKRVLFVDDLKVILLSMERLLRPYAEEWEMTFANSAKEALELIDKQPFDIIVSDVVMPEMDGVELLETIKQRHPNMIRFILSGNADYQTLVKSANATHQFLTKPCRGEILVEAISRALALRNLFKDETLLELVKDASSLPTLPELYRELTRELASSTCSADRIAEILEQDISISAKVLQLVNSSFFNLSRSVDSLAQATMLLGAETISALAFTSSIFDAFDETTVQTFKIREIFAHSLRVGHMARSIACETELEKRETEEVMLAGMMHDLGKLALIESGNPTWRRLYFETRKNGLPLEPAERDQLGITHSEIGAYLLGVWGLSNTVIEAVAYHHQPTLAPHAAPGALACVYLANRFDHHYHQDPSPMLDLDMDYLKRAGMADNLESYQRLYVEECTQAQG